MMQMWMFGVSVDVDVGVDACVYAARAGAGA